MKIDLIAGARPNFMNAGGGTQAEQTAAIMIGYERLLIDDKPDLCLVVGDVTSTMACSIAAQKLCVPLPVSLYSS